MIPTDLKPEYIVGNVLDILKTLPDECVQTVVTSPPYWGLRDYKNPDTIWGGNPDCEHVWGDFQTGRVMGGGDRPPDNKWKNVAPDGDYDSQSQRAFCTKCNAWKGQLGLEPTPELYVEHLVMIFDEVNRVLRKDGILWLNLGDSFFGGGGSSGHTSETKNLSRKTDSYGAVSTSGRSHDSLKPKDLVGIPWMVAFALRSAGWYLRCDIIWHKPNPMPESVTDRPTKSHEYIFLLSKSRKYYYDNEAIKEHSITNEDRPDGIVRNREYNYDSKENILRNHKNTQEKGQKVQSFHKHRDDGKSDVIYKQRNKRSVWSINTRGYKGAHFAVFPPELPELCIKAGTPIKCCGICGEPWERITKTTRNQTNKRMKDWREIGWEQTEDGRAKATGNPIQCTNPEAPEVTTIGWKPTCEHNDDSGRSVVMDIFAGSGTTLQVARSLGRRSIGIDINNNYRELAIKRAGLKRSDLFSFGGD